MKNLKNKINDLVQKGLIEEEVSEQDYKIFHRIFSFYLNQELALAQDEKIIIVESLNRAVAKKKEEKEKLANLNKINYIGEYLEIYFRHYELDSALVAKEIGIEESVLHKLLNNKIKLFDISPQKLAKLLKYLNLKYEQAKEMLIKTIFRDHNIFSAKLALARYSNKKGLEEKGKSMNAALNELLFKANQTELGFTNNDELNKQTLLYLDELANYMD